MDWAKPLLANRSQVLTTAPPVTAKLQLLVKAMQQFESVARRAESHQVSENRRVQVNRARL